MGLRLLSGFFGLGSALTLALPLSPVADYRASCSLVQYINGGSTPVSVKIEASCFVDTNNNNLESDCTGTVGYVVRGFKTSVVKNNKADYIYMGAPGRRAASPRPPQGPRCTARATWLELRAPPHGPRTSRDARLTPSGSWRSRRWPNCPRLTLCCTDSPTCAQTTSSAPTSKTIRRIMACTCPIRST